MTVAASGVDFRWGCEVEDRSRNGGTTIPGYVLRNYHKLGIAAHQMMFIIHLSAFHFNSEKGKASPSLKTIADLMGYKKDDSARNIVKDLKTAGWLKVETKRGKNSIYDFGALSRKCLELDKAETPSHSDGVPQSDGTLVSHSDGGVLPHSDGNEDKEVKNKNPRKRKGLADTPPADSAPPDEPTSDPVPEKQEPSEEPAPKPPLPHIAIIDAWYDGMPAPPIKRKYPRNVRTAKNILEAGYTPAQVKACTQDKYAKSNRPDSQIKLEWIEDDLPLWVKAGKNGTTTNRPPARASGSPDDRRGSRDAGQPPAALAPPINFPDRRRPAAVQPPAVDSERTTAEAGRLPDV